MIPNKNKDILISKLRLGYTILESCKLSQISKPTLYRYLKDPRFRHIFDEAIFYANSKIDTAKKEADEELKQRNWAEMKKIALRKRN